MTTTQEASPEARGSQLAEEAGLAYVATASFLASRLVPTGGFAVALAGGTALARCSERLGWRAGYGASLAAMLQTVAIMGPARLGVPLTQAISAPLLGRMHARGVGIVPRFGACAGIRAVDQALTLAFFIFVIIGGIDAYAASYDGSFASWFGLPQGPTPALLLTALALVGWTVFASAVQVLVYERGLRHWPSEEADAGLAGRARAERSEPSPAAFAAPRFDPRVVALAGGVLLVVLIAGLTWPVLAAVTLLLVVVWPLSRGEREPLRPGFAFAALLAAGVLMASVFGDLGVDETARRTLRAALLVVVATWLRAAAGEEGLREVARRSLGRVRRLPTAAEAGAVLDRLGSAHGLEASGRALGDTVGGVRRRPLPMASAVLRWVAREAAGFRPPPPTALAEPRAGWPDAVLLGAALATGGALLA